MNTTIIIIAIVAVLAIGGLLVLDTLVSRHIDNADRDPYDGEGW